MKTKFFSLIRDTFGPDYTVGTLWFEGTKFGEVLEDKDRHLGEDGGGDKVQNETAIPIGVYRLTLDYSPHFGKIMPHILNVDQFSGVRMHGGNTVADTEGCPLCGLVRVSPGVIGNCHTVVERIIETITQVENDGNECWIAISRTDG
jgi:hypothetical protein